MAQNNYVKNNFSSLCFHFLQLTSFKRPSRQLPEEISHLTFNFEKVELLSSLMTQLHILRKVRHLKDSNKEYAALFNHLWVCYIGS